MAVTLTDVSLEALTRLVNGWGTLPRQEDGRGEAPHLPVADITARLDLPARVSAALTPTALACAADRLHAVFSAPDSEACAHELTRLLSDSGVRPVMASGTAGTLRAAWNVDDADQALVAAAAITLRKYLVERGFARIGICTGGHCADVYIDQSPGGRRRFCSVACQNRTRVAAFRSRRAAADD
ncbi:CGNR zinc finger domain-containing protein [Streptomyces kunmingensis]|uniref:CGNR zinc finger domain-containing protein n=1 Tax=Streptomyces kunmingensis TaxID=68225 RepID=A0ABU6CP34_9ACTN|nr:CGNR zinc finger domain-containing protein [Streptomyces kunmingensis]MEB3965731.1 CGNR zinc finger domain-containing protein [Streptomyces kunmingensis]